MFEKTFENTEEKEANCSLFTAVAELRANPLRFVGEPFEAVEAVHERILELGFASQEHHRRPSVDAELVYWPRDERSPRHLLCPER